MENIQSKIWKLLGENTALPNLDDDTLFSALFTASYRGNISFLGKTVLILGESKLSEIASKLAFELKASRVLLAGRETLSQIKEEMDAIHIILACSEQDLLEEQGISISSFSALEGYLETSPNVMRTKTLLDAEKENKNTMPALFFWVSAYAIFQAKLKGDYVDPNTIQSVYNAFLRTENNLILLGIPEYAIDDVATQIGAISGRLVVYLNEVNIKMMDLKGITGKILVAKEDIVSNPNFEYPLFANSTSFFVSSPLLLLEGNPKPGTRESRMKHYLNSFNYFADHTYEYRDDIGLASSEIWKEFLKSPYAKRI